MKKVFFSLLLFVTLMPASLSAADGDSLIVQTFTFGSPQNAWFHFPTAGEDYQRILMLYTLKCVPGGAGGLPYPCGEWDYTTHTFLYQHTGQFDSSLQYQKRYVVKGQSPDTIRLNSSPTWTFSRKWNYFPVRTNVLSLDTAAIDLGGLSSPNALPSGAISGSSVFLYTATELSAAGLQAGDITGLRLQVQQSGTTCRELTLLLSPTMQDSLVAGNLPSTGWQEVYKRSFVPASGWQQLDFHNSFNWDGSSNLLVQFQTTNSEQGTNTIIEGHSTSFSSGLAVASNDYCLNFRNGDWVDVPAQAFSGLDSFVTVMFWQYGGPGQPQNDMLFEGLNAAGQRVLNVHLPWSDGRVYWDAGQDGFGYDRIDKVAQPGDYKDGWNHWAFTKNAQTGVMRIYLNGVQWLAAGNRTRNMAGITQFRIGSRGNGTGYFYDGKIDAFSAWNEELTPAAIQQLMHEPPTAAFPQYNRLLFQYDMNEGSGILLNDSGPGTWHGGLNGLPAWEPAHRLRPFAEIAFRPDVIFEQGFYQGYTDSLMVTDSAALPPFSVVEYASQTQPQSPTDTLYGWPPAWGNYQYNAQGVPTDSAWIGGDIILVNSQTAFYVPFEVVNRIELARFITPYGINLDLGDGFTWVEEVTDYGPLLVDSVHLSAGNWQELLDLKFLFIKGTPARKPLSVRNLWSGEFYLNNFNQQVAARSVIPNSGSSSFRIKTRTSGHLFSNPTNCAEFCPRQNKLSVDGFEKYNWLVWKGCGDNPLYPQGGTWIYDRADWCPGDWVTTRNWEMTPHVTPGNTHSIKYDIEAEQHGLYILETQWIEYGPAPFEHDVSVIDIIAPSNQHIYGRFNPLCGSPIIKIRNTGTKPLTRCDIAYGVDGGRDCYFRWEGNLLFMEEAIVTLPPFDWNGLNPQSPRFHVAVDRPNGKTDEYEGNNRLSSEFTTVTSFADSVFIILFRSNNAPQESYYMITGEYGDTLYLRDNFTANTIYRDTFRLEPGCYDFTIYDRDGDGINFWANNDGNGYLRYKTLNMANYITIQPDFGSYWKLQFMMMEEQGNATPKDTCAPFEYEDPDGVFSPNNDHSRLLVYPNPAAGTFNLSLDLDRPSPVIVRVYDQWGNLLHEDRIAQVQYLRKAISLETGRSGMAFIQVITEEEQFSRKVFLTR